MIRLIASICIILFISSCHRERDIVYTNPTKDNQSHKDVSFLDSTYGMVVGSFGIVLVTNDGGNIWKHRYYGETKEESKSTDNQYLNCIEIVDNQNSYIGGEYFGQAIILKSIDGGEIYRTINLGVTGHVLNLHFLNNLIGFALTKPDKFAPAGDKYPEIFSNHLFKTLDGGETWNEVLVPTGKSFFNFTFLNEQKGFLIGESQHILHTIDGGKTWKQQYKSEIQSYRNSYIQFVSDSIGFIAGDQSFFRTDDGGETWNNLGIFTSEQGSVPFSCAAFKFTSQNEGILYPSRGEQLYYTVDGGYNWYSKKINTSSIDFWDSIKAIEVVSKSKIIAVSNSKIIAIDY